MHGLPMFWTPEELAHLEGTSIAAKMAHRTGNALASLCAVEPLCRVSSSGFGSGSASNCWPPLSHPRSSGSAFGVVLLGW